MGTKRQFRSMNTTLYLVSALLGGEDSTLSVAVLEAIALPLRPRASRLFSRYASPRPFWLESSFAMPPLRVRVPGPQVDLRKLLRDSANREADRPTSFDGCVRFIPYASPTPIATSSLGISRRKFGEPHGKSFDRQAHYC
jgi:hypothetical protein